MQYVKFGKTGITISTIGFGSWAIGGMNWGKTDDEVSKLALHTALDMGVNFIDTADVYGFGHSEILISEVIKERKGKNVIIATKAGNDFYNAGKTDDSGYGAIKQTYDKKYLIFAAEQSIKRLGVEAIDILQLHSGDLENLERDDPWEALETLKRQGTIRFAGWSIQSFKETEHSHLIDRYKDVLDCIQLRYNLLEREAEKVLLPKAQKYNLGVIVRIPLLFGLLTGKFTRETKFDEDDHRKFNLSPEKLDKYLTTFEEKITPLFERYPNQTKSQVSLRFCLSHLACHTAIPGAKTPQQASDNCKASDLGAIPKEFIPALD